MKDLPNLIAAIDVAVVDPDLLWRVEHMNLLRKLVVREFAAREDAFEALTPGHPSVVVLGPTLTDEAGELEGLADDLAARPEVRSVVCWPAEPSAEDQQRGRFADVVMHVDVDDERFTRVVTDLVARADRTGPRRAEDAAADVFVEADTAAGPGPATTSPTTEAEGTPAGADAGPVWAEDLPRDRPRRRQQLPARLAVFTSAKGGEGVSTAALNVAHAIAVDTHTSTAIVDGEPSFGDIGFDLGEMARSSVALRDLPIPDDVADRLISRPEEGGPLVVHFPSPRGSLGDQPADVLRDLLALAGERADVVVADVPWELLLASGLAGEAAIVAIVTSRRAASIKNTVVAAHRLGLADNVGLVVNEIDRRRRATPIEEIVRTVGLPLLGHLPFSGTLSRNASMMPLHELAEQRSRYGRATAELLQQVAAHFPILV